MLKIRNRIVSVMFTRFDKVSSKHMFCRYQYLTSSLGFQPLRSLLTLSFRLLNTAFQFGTETHINAFSFSIFTKNCKKTLILCLFFIIFFVKKIFSLYYYWFLRWLSWKFQVTHNRYRRCFCLKGSLNYFWSKLSTLNVIEKPHWK